MKSIKILYFNSPKYDLITALHIEGLLKQNDIQIRFTDSGNYAPPDKVLSDSEIIDFANKEAEIIILGSRTRPQNNKTHLFEKINRHKQFFIKMEGGDESSLDCSISEFFKFDLIFKREIFEKDWSYNSFRYSFFRGYSGLWKTLRAHKLIPFPHYHSLASNLPFLLHLRNIMRNLFYISKPDKVLPFPLGIEDRFIGNYNPKPKYTLCCIMRAHNSERKEIIRILNDRYHDQVCTEANPPQREDFEWMLDRGAFSSNYYHSQDKKDDFHSLGIGSAHNIEYYKILNNSRACLALPGGGFDTLRSWETLAQGTLLIAKRSSLTYPHKLIDREHYLGFDTHDELFDLIDWVFDNPLMVNSIREKGQKYALKYHSSKARSDYFLKTLKKLTM